jgi:hypothetical protein
MPKYIIKATYNYETKNPIEAPTPERAEAVFLSDLNLYYVSTEEIEFTIVCDECEEDEWDCSCDEEEEVA